MARRKNDETPTADELGRVFGAAPEQFTAERDALSRDLRGAGRSAAAASVKALRRPPLAVWVVNQLARRHPGETAAVLEAGAALAAAQAAVLGGGGGGALRAASEKERAAAAALASLGGRLLAAFDHPEEPTLQRVRRTLHALPSAREDEREQVRLGVLDHEIEPAAFGGLLGGDAPAPPARARPPPAPAPAPRVDARAAAAEQARRKDQVKRARAALAEAEKESKRAQTRLAAAERELQAATAAADAARARVEEARRTLAEISEGATAPAR